MNHNPIITSGFDARLNQKDFRLITMEGMEEVAYRDHGRFLNVIQTDAETEVDFLYNGLGDVPQIQSAELGILPTASGFRMGPEVSYTVEEFGYKYVYTKRSAELDRMGLIVSTVGSMGEGAAETIENVAVKIFNDNLTRAGGWDNKPLASLTHELLDGSVYSNILTAGGPSFHALQSIYNYVNKGVRNDNGRIIRTRIKGLEVAPELVPIWRQLVASPTQAGQPNPNVKNPFDADLLTPDKIYPNGRLTGTYDTHILLEGHHLNMFVRKSPTTRTWNTDEPEAIVHAIEFELVVGHTDARRYLYLPGN